MITSPPRIRGGLRWWVFCLALFAWWVRYHPPGVDLLVFDDDARQHVYWTAKFQDPELFQDDILTEFISSPLVDPLGYQLLYRLGTSLLDPLVFSQLLSLLLLVSSLWLLESWARSFLPDSRGRIVLSMMFLFFSLYNSSGGFPRGFAYPLLLGFLLLQRKNAMGWAGLLVILEALFYPPILLNTLAMAAVGALETVKSLGLRRELVGKYALFGACCMLSFGILLAVYGPWDRALMGRQITVEEARELPEFHEYGRSKFFRDNVVEYLLLGRSGVGGEYLLGFGTILVGMAAAGGLRVLRAPRVAIHLAWTSLVLFGAAHVLLFKLHLPSRYTIYTLPLAVMLTVGASSGPFWDTAGATWRRLWEALPAWAKGAKARFALILGLGFIYAWAQGYLIVRVDTQMVAVDTCELEMLRFLGGLPKNAVIAGHPLDMDNVPLVARRKVLANHELSLPYHIGYYRKIRDRLLDTFRAYYAEDWDTVERFVKQHNIQALVVNKDRFKGDLLEKRIYYEPFDSVVKRSLMGQDKFVLVDPPSGHICFENKRFVVLCWPY